MNQKHLHSLLLLTLFIFSSCTSKEEKELKVSYLKEKQIKQLHIPFSIIAGKDKLKSKHIESVKCSLLDSIVFINNNPDQEELYTTPIALDFTKKIEQHSPEYYTIYIVHSIDKAIEYYNKLFDNKLDFNSQTEYKDIQITFGDVPLITTPKNYILEKGTNPSPSIFYHEIGHRAFWLLEDSLNIKFKGLSYIHMGLLEYFTVSLTDSPVVGEDIFRPLLIRDASSSAYSYPADSTLTLNGLFTLIKESYPRELNNPKSNIARFYKAYEDTYKEYFNSILDNHRAGMIITSTLWRVRKQLGQEITDKLVAQTILDLNKVIEKRPNFYSSHKNEKLLDKIEWYDLLYGLITKDKETNNGEGSDIIIKEFEKTGFPVHQVDIYK